MVVVIKNPPTNKQMQETQAPSWVSERVTGRKARGLQMEEIACKCQTFFLSLKQQEETN